MTRDEWRREQIARLNEAAAAPGFPTPYKIVDLGNGLFKVVELDSMEGVKITRRFTDQELESNGGEDA